MKELPILSFELITPVSQASQSALEASLARQGFKVFHIDGRDVTDATAFLASAREGLPLPGPSPRGWSGLVDQLWQGLHEVAAESATTGGAPFCCTPTGARVYTLR